jgi:hypothetical protein
MSAYQMLPPAPRTPGSRSKKVLLIVGVSIVAAFGGLVGLQELNRGSSIADSTQETSPVKFTSGWVEQAIVDGDWDRAVVKSATCMAEDVDYTGVGTYECKVKFLAVKDELPYLAEVNSEGVWAAEPDYSTTSAS